MCPVRSKTLRSPTPRLRPWCSCHGRKALASPAATPAVHRATRRQIAGVVALGAVVLVAALLLSPQRALRELEAIAGRPLVFGAALLAAYMLRPLVAWPISAFSLLLGYLYGPLGFPVALAGAVVTSLPPYGLARLTGETGFLGRAGTTGRRYFDTIGDTRGVVVARLAPLPADPISYGIGLAGVSLGPFALGTTVGETPWTAGAVLVGSSMGALTVDGFEAGLPLLVGTGLLALLVIAGPLYRRWYREEIGAGGETPSSQ